MDKRKFIIYGAGDFAHTVYTIIKKRMNREVAFFCVDDIFFKTNCLIEGIPIRSRSELNNITDKAEYSMAIGFVGNEMSKDRELKYNELKKLGFYMENVLDTKIDYPENIGEGNIIMQQVFVGCDVKVGECNIVWPSGVFPHNNRIGSFNIFGPSVSLSGNSCVRNHCFIGNNVSIKNQVIIEDYTFVGAGAYVRDSTTRESVIVPAHSVVLENKSCWDFKLV